MALRRAQDSQAQQVTHTAAVGARTLAHRAALVDTAHVFLHSAHQKVVFHGEINFVQTPAIRPNTI